MYGLSSSSVLTGSGEWKEVVVVAGTFLSLFKGKGKRKDLPVGVGEK